MNVYIRKDSYYKECEARWDRLDFVRMIRKTMNPRRFKSESKEDQDAIKHVYTNMIIKSDYCTIPELVDMCNWILNNSGCMLDPKKKSGIRDIIPKNEMDFLEN